MVLLVDRLRRAVKKLSYLLNLKKYLGLTQSTLRLASIISRSKAPERITGRAGWGRRAISFNDRPGLRSCVADEDHLEEQSPRSESQEYNNDGRSSFGNSPRRLERTTSYPLEEDVDRQADMFIHNFYKHLIMEKQVSLNLRYCRDTSFDYSSADTVVSPFSTTSSNLLSPT